MNIQQHLFKELYFWRPTTKRPYDNPLWASVTQIDGRAKISIPATSKAVQRTIGNGAYLLRFSGFLATKYVQNPPLAQTTLITQGYSDIDGAAAPRVAKIFGATAIHHNFVNHTQPASDSIGRTLYVEDTVTFGGITLTPSIADPTSVITTRKPEVGTFGQCITSKADTSGTQYIWMLEGNSGINSFNPSTIIDIATITKTAPNTFSTEVIYRFLGTNTLFPAACVIEGDRYLNWMLYTGGMSDWSTLSVSSKLIDHTGATITVPNCPISFTKASAVAIPGCGCLLLSGGLSDDLTDSRYSTYFYMPYTNSWQAGPTLITARRDHQSTIITNTFGNSYVLVVGGKQSVFKNIGQSGPNFYPIGTPVNKCETLSINTSVPGEYPTSSFTAAGSMADARYAFGMVTLPDGRVLVCGGIGYNPSYPIADNTVKETLYELKSCEIFDPSTMSWSTISPMLDAHSYCTCFYVPGTNKVYVGGGFTSQTYEYLDLSTMQWSRSSRYTSNGIDKCPIAGAAPIRTSLGFNGLIGGGTYHPTTDSFSSNSLPTTISSWNGMVLDSPEFNRSDGLNAEWHIDSYSSTDDSWQLSSSSLGDYANTSTAWSDPYVTLGVSDFIFVNASLIPNPGIGPYSFDLQQSFAISKNKLTITQDIFKGAVYDSIKVTSGASSVTEGYLLFNFGYENQVGPVKCFGFTDDNTLQIDSGFKFPYYLPIGTIVNVLFQRGGFEPTNTSGGFWLTASNIGRAAAIDTLKMISAAGIELDITTRYPGDRGLGDEGYPVVGNYKLSDVVEIFGSDNIDQELADARSAS